PATIHRSCRSSGRDRYGRARCVMRGRRADAGVEGEKKVARGTVGAMDRKAPAEPIGLGADLRPVAAHARRIIRPPRLRAAGSEAATTFRLDEFDASPIRKRLFGGIDDLHDMAVRAAAGELRDGASDLADLAPEIGQENDLGERGGGEGR